MKAVYLVAAVMGAFALMAVCSWRSQVRVQHSSVVELPAAAAERARPPAPIVAVDEPDGARLGAMMTTDDAIAEQVVFLAAAALRGRCSPRGAHDLPRMAVVAGLPVLSVGGGASAADVSKRQTISHVVRDIVARAPCDGTFTLRIGTYARDLDLAAYARAFPDSYFDPGLSTAPGEFGNEPLERRAVDECNRVAYAVLPLDAARPWQCAGLRASARKRARAVCHTQDAEAAANDIRSATDALPLSCQ